MHDLSNIWGLVVWDDEVAAPLDALATDKRLRRQLGLNPGADEAGIATFGSELRFAVSNAAETADREARISFLPRGNLKRANETVEAIAKIARLIEEIEAAFRWHDPHPSSPACQERAQPTINLGALQLSHEERSRFSGLEADAREAVHHAAETIRALNNAAKTLAQAEDLGRPQAVWQPAFIRGLGVWWTEKTGRRPPRGEVGPFVRLVKAGLDTLTLAGRKMKLPDRPWQPPEELGQLVKRALSQVR